jgi:hypothetical protein
MNEAFRVALRRNGKRWPIQTYSHEGIILDNEVDAFPRSVTLEFGPNNDITTYRMNRVRQLKGWAASQYELNDTLADGALMFSGVDPLALPSGNYWLSLTVGDLDVTPSTIRFNIDDNDSSQEVLVDVKPDPRSITIEPFASYDRTIRNLIENDASVIDGLPAERWLDAKEPRPSRKACLLNLLAKLRTAPSVSDSLLAEVQSIFFAGTERVYGQVTPNLFKRLQLLANDAARKFYYEGNPASATHLLLLDHLESKGLGRRQDYTLHSFRQEGQPSMQIVVATPSVGGSPFCADFDIDLGNPLQDVDGFVRHMGELAFGGDTDHLELAKSLAKGTTADFLYYTVNA